MVEHFIGGVREAGPMHDANGELKLPCRCSPMQFAANREGADALDIPHVHFFPV
jgi:hypothetical protein